MLPIQYYTTVTTEKHVKIGKYMIIQYYSMQSGTNKHIELTTSQYNYFYRNKWLKHKQFYISHGITKPKQLIITILQMYY